MNDITNNAVIIMENEFDYYTSKKCDEFENDILKDSQKLNECIIYLYKYKIVNSKTAMEKLLNKREYMENIVNSLIDWNGKKRQGDYQQESRQGILPWKGTIHSNRREEIICKLLKGLDEKHYIDYQVPLKPQKCKENKGYGKIDLLYKEDNGDVRLIELKKYESEENIARAMLECCTYFKQLDIDEFKKYYNVQGKIIPTIAVSEKMLKLFDESIYRELYKLLHEIFGLEIFKYIYNDNKGLEVNDYEMKIVEEITLFPFERNYYFE